MIIFSKKLDPILKLKLKERKDNIIPVIVSLKEPLSNKLKNSISKNRGKLKYEYKHILSAALQISPEGVDKLSEMPEIGFISYDRKAEICMDRAAGAVGVNSSSTYNLSGRNVNIAIIDTGAYPHGDLMRPFRVVTHFKDFINSHMEPYDDNGHGTHICGIIAGSGSLSGGKYKGIAQNSRLIMLKAFNSVGAGSFSDIIAAIDWTLENMEKYKIRILCLPFGADAIVPSYKDPLCIACEAACRSGIVVIAASGNKGSSQGSITTPGISPLVITVGCCESQDLNKGKWKIPDFSGRGGKIESEMKPDFIAPGVNITSTSSDICYIPGDSRDSFLKPLERPYCSMTGTSQSTAIAVGCISLIMEKMPDLSGKDLKGLLKLSCQTLNEPKASQGSGVLNMQKILSKE